MNEKVKTAPNVGIFWGVPAGHAALVTDVTPLAAAEPYGDFLTHPRGHYQVWEGWRRLGPAGLTARGLPLVVAFHEYDEFPRGRIVFDARARLFIIYADRELQAVAIVERIVRGFGLAGRRCFVCSDWHYRS